MNNFGKLKEMFQKMVVKKNASLMPKYYHPGFVLISNGQQMNFAEMVLFHEEIYKTQIKYSISYDQETAVEQGDRIALRCFITTERPGEPANEIEVMLICQYQDEKIYRIWELTFPDWSSLPAFKDDHTH